MALKCGIVGLPNVGKSTLFNCLSNAKAQSAKFSVLHHRTQRWRDYGSRPHGWEQFLAEDGQAAECWFPLPWRVWISPGSSKVPLAKERALAAWTLGSIRETDAILHVLRCFDDGKCGGSHRRDSVDPIPRQGGDSG